MKLFIVFLLAFAALARAAVVLELDAAALPAGKISETQNAIALNLCHSTPANQ